MPPELTVNQRQVMSRYEQRWPYQRRLQHMDRFGDSDFAGPEGSFPIQTQEDVYSAVFLLNQAPDPATVASRIYQIANAKGLEVPMGSEGSTTVDTGTQTYLDRAERSNADTTAVSVKAGAATLSAIPKGAKLDHLPHARIALRASAGAVKAAENGDFQRAAHLHKTAAGILESLGRESEMVSHFEGRDRHFAAAALHRKAASAYGGSMAANAGIDEGILVDNAEFPDYGSLIQQAASPRLMARLRKDGHMVGNSDHGYDGGGQPPSVTPPFTHGASEDEYYGLGADSETVDDRAWLEQVLGGAVGEHSFDGPATANPNLSEYQTDGGDVGSHPDTGWGYRNRPGGANFQANQAPAPPLFFGQGVSTIDSPTVNDDGGVTFNQDYNPRQFRLEPDGSVDVSADPSLQGWMPDCAQIVGNERMSGTSLDLTVNGVGEGASPFEGWGDGWSNFYDQTRREMLRRCRNDSARQALMGNMRG